MNLGHLAALLLLALTTEARGEPPQEDPPQELAFPGRTGTVRSGVFDTPEGTFPLTYEAIDGYGVVEGDILVAAPGRDETPRAGVRSSFWFHWDQAVIPYEFAPGFPNRSRVTDAMAHWEAVTPIRFVEDPTAPHRLRFWQGSGPMAGCASWVGRQHGVQEVLFDPSCGTGAALHELGHAVGLFHEQARDDRDGFVTIMWSCIQGGRGHNFNRYWGDGRDVGAYDFNSLMHYGSGAFLDSRIPGCRATLLRTDGTWIFPNRTALSPGDIAGVRDLYGSWWARRMGREAGMVAVDSFGGVYGIPPDRSGVWRYRGPDDWEWMGGPAERIYAGGDKVYVTKSDGTVHRWEGGTRWTHIGGAGASFAVDASGTLYGLTPSRDEVWRFTGIPHVWDRIRGPARDIYAGGPNVYATKPSGQIDAWDSLTWTWTEVGRAGAMFAVDLNGTLYGLTPDRDAIWRYSGTPYHWTPVGGPASAIYPSGRTGVFATSPDDDMVFRYDGASWSRVNGPVRALVSGGDVVVGLDKDTGRPYLYTPM
jgi:hypothetical protein